jgi:hypothetical protein
MEARATPPRLSQIDPRALGRIVEDELVRDLSQRVAALLPRCEIDVREWRSETDDSDVSLWVQALVIYAREGTPLDGPVLDYRLSLINVLAPPIEDDAVANALCDSLDEGRDIDTLDGSELLDKLALVLCAARARECIETSHPVAAGGLAALAGCSNKELWKRAMAGELELNYPGISADSARAWLIARGVPGFDRPTHNDPSRRPEVPHQGPTRSSPAPPAPTPSGRPDRKREPLLPRR